MGAPGNLKFQNRGTHNQKLIRVYVGYSIEVIRTASVPIAVWLAQYDLNTGGRLPRSTRSRPAINRIAERTCRLEAHKTQC